MPTQAKLTRRALTLGTLGLAYVSLSDIAHGQVATPAIASEDRPEPIDLGSGIVLTDFRIIPGVEPTRFLIEIESQRDDVIDTPVIGAIVPDAPAAESFTWAAPWHNVLDPGASTFAVGLLPANITSTQQLEWTLCDGSVGPGTSTQQRSAWQWEMESSLETLDHDAARIHLEITNTNSEPMRFGVPRGLIRDDNGRICGAPPQPSPISIQPDTTIERSLGFNRNWDSPVNPFLLCENPEEMRVFMDIQPLGPPVQPGCPAVMPWNRND